VSHDRSGLEVAGPFGLIGAFWIGAGLYQIWRGYGTSNWRPVPGEILDAYLSEEEQEDTDMDSRSYGQKQFFYKPGVTFRYSVRDKEYEGDLMQEGLFRFPWRSFAENQIAGYRSGQRVTVYVSPRDPSKAVLKRGPPPQAFMMFAAGIFTLIVALVFYKLVP
jgi:hypothetical protein